MRIAAVIKPWRNRPGSDLSALAADEFSSGWRTRLACWRRRLVIADFLDSDATLVIPISAKDRFGVTPTLARCS